MLNRSMESVEYVMQFINMLIILIILSLDCFVVIMEKGAVMPFLSWKKILKYSGVFSIISVFMFIAGYLLGLVFHLQDLRIFNWMILSLLFILMGSRFLYGAVSKGEFVERLNKNIDTKDIAKAAIRTSIDLFLLGVSICIIDINLWRIGLTALIITFLIAIIAFKVGQYYGAKYHKAIYWITAILSYVTSILIIFISIK